VIASQALISGAFSLTMQAVQLGYLPRLPILHTSEQQEGQIFVGPVNRAIMVGSITLVLAFQSSSNLAAAYGIAVSLTMGITTILLSQIARRRWRWPRWRIVAVCGFFFVIELAFIIANMTKIANGGWVPLLLGAALLFTMMTWKRGRNLLADKMADMSLPLDELVASLRLSPPVRVRGTAIYLSASPGQTPSALLHNLKHNQVLHHQTVVLNVQGWRVPRVEEADRLEVQDLGEGMWRVTARHGFMETPDIPAALRACAPHGLAIEPARASFFLGRETIVATRENLPHWQAKYFAFLSRSSQSAMEFFKLPPNRVIELGAQIEL
jgi:KUP system potassium uptake protein